MKNTLKRKDEILLEIAKRNNLVRKEQEVTRLSDGKRVTIKADLTPANSDSLDFYEVSVTSIKKALEEAFKAGYMTAAAVVEQIERIE